MLDDNNISKEMIIKNPDLIKKYEGYNESLFELAINNGYIPAEEDLKNNFYMCYSDSVMKSAIMRQANLVKYYEGSDKNIFVLAIEQGYIPNYNDLKNHIGLCYNSFIMKRAILDDVSLITLYRGSDEEIFSLAINNGYIPTEEDLTKYPNFTKSYSIIKKAIFIHGNFIKFYKSSFETEEDKKLFDLAIKNGYKVTEDDLIKYPDLCDDVSIMTAALKIDKNLSKYYNGLNNDLIKTIIASYINIVNDDFINAWKICCTTEQRDCLISLLNEEFIAKIGNVGINFHMLIRYAIKNPKIKEMKKIIDNKQIDEFLNMYTFFKNKFYNNDKKAFGIDRFLNIALNYNRYNKLLHDLYTNKTELNQNQVANLYYLFDNRDTLNISTVDELNDIGHKLDEKTLTLLNDELITNIEIKNIILLYLCNHTYDEVIYILGHLINYETLDALSRKYNSEDVSVLKIFILMIEETVNSISDKESLIKVAKNIVENKSLVNEIRPYFYNIEERIRSIYEMDANKSLINFNNLPRNAKYYKDKYTSSDTVQTGFNNILIGNKKVDYCDLSDSNYSLYCHVCSTSLIDLVNPNYAGRVFICLSPATNYGKKLYRNSNIAKTLDNVVVGYTNLPQGSFIGSSNHGLMSNYYSEENNYMLKTESNYYQMEFTASSATPYDFSETIVYRDGMIPSCIVITGDTPNQVEIDAAAFLSFILKKSIPLVKAPAKQEREIKFNTKLEADNHSNTLKIQLQGLKDSLLSLDVNKDQIENIIPIKIGGSHDMYKCIINGERYFLKPGARKNNKQLDPYRSYAMECGYIMQSIINPAGAVEVKLVYAPVGEDHQNILCSAIKEIKNSYDYSTWLFNKHRVILTKKEVCSLLKEFIVDHLIYNYDCKVENFIKDQDDNVYGIDKEQSLKFIFDFCIKDEKGKIVDWDTTMTYKFNPNNVIIIYKRLFENYIDGYLEIDDEIIDECIKTIDKVQSINDSQYLNIFSKFVENYCSVNQYNEELKQKIYEGILIRKKNIKQDFINFISSQKEKRNQNNKKK